MWTHKEWNKYLVVVSDDDDDGKINNQLRADRVDYWYRESPTVVSVTMASGNTNKITGSAKSMDQYAKVLSDAISGKLCPDKEE